MGVLKISNDSIVPFVNSTQGLLSNKVKKVLFYNSKIFASNLYGIQVFDTNASLLLKLDIQSGLLANNVIDFDVYGDTLVVLNSLGLQIINLSKIHPNLTPPLLDFHVLQLGEFDLTSDSKRVFSHNENQFKVEFRARAYSHMGKLNYSFRLKGHSEHWEVVPFDKNSVVFSALSPGTYEFQVMAKNELGIESKVRSTPFTIRPPIWERWWFYLLITIGLLIGAALIFRLRINRLKRQSKQHNELISSKLTAIQSQMNPHFIFNALNSIQDLVLKEDIDNSYRYIVTFSNLLRRTLNYSDKDFIDFDSEIKLIELYLKLEKLRFKTNFEYVIETNNIEGIECASNAGSTVHRKCP